MKLQLTLICCWMCLLSAAQQLPSAWLHKLSPRLGKQPENALPSEGHRRRFLLACSDTALIQQLSVHHTDSFEVRYRYGNIFSVLTYPQWIRTRLLPLSSVTFIDEHERRPKEEVVIAGFDYTTNGVNKTHRDYPDLNGGGTVVSIREDEPDTADIDFKGRFLATPAGSGTLSSHATIMGTIIAGGGNSFYTGKGVAWGAILSSSPFGELLPDADSLYQRYGITVQNHSYGTGIENYYGADAAAYDACAVNNPTLLQVFSSGNSGDQTSTEGPYQGISGWSNLTGSFKMAKNILTVGSVDSFGRVPLLSSKGPAYDGRIKPELVAYGEDGSSGAAALVSGSALLLQQAYKLSHGGSIPDAALVKAMLLNSAMTPAIATTPATTMSMSPTTAITPAISFTAGFGNLDTWRAVREMQAGHYFSGSVTQGAALDFPLSLPAAAKNLKVLLCWTDPPAMPNAPTALVNDLDITLYAGGQSWLPWVLDPSPARLAAPPVRGRDQLNTEEIVTVETPPSGGFTIHIEGSRVVAGEQRFYVAYQWDTAGVFRWRYPTAEDNLLPGQPNLLRWEGTPGILDYKIAGRNDWTPVTGTLTGSYYAWTTPDTSAVVQLRMKTGGREYLSDTVGISPRAATGVGLNCPDSVLLYWDRSAANKYTLYRLGARYLEPQLTVNDTAVLLRVTPGVSSWYVIAPVLPYQKTGLKTYAFDYTQQGVGCYINNFTADQNGAAAALRLELGSLYSVMSVVIEKRMAAADKPIGIFTPPIGLDYRAADDSLHQGVNTYRAKLVLSDGRVLYSDDQSVYYSGKDLYVLYPNPVQQGQPVHLIASGLYNPVLQLYNLLGQLVMEKTVVNLLDIIPTTPLKPGLYFYRLQAAGQQTVTGKLIVL